LNTTSFVSILDTRKKYPIPAWPNTFPWHDDTVTCYCTNATKIRRHSLFCSIIELTNKFLRFYTSAI
jgi:hypothetical protein